LRGEEERRRKAGGRENGKAGAGAPPFLSLSGFPAFAFSSTPPLHFEIASRTTPPDAPRMSDIIYPRSARETMCGWMHLPRYLDKIRLHLAGKLHPDYQPNFGTGFDGRWLKSAGLTHEQFVEVVKGTHTDGEVADWVLKNVKRSDADRKAHADIMLN
jgi:hypothetical protein